jgi:hypothetical protein
MDQSALAIGTIQQSAPSPRVRAAQLLDRGDLPAEYRKGLSRIIGWRKISTMDAAVINRIAELMEGSAGS